MNWFGRHLNWTAVTVTIFGMVFTVFLALNAQGYNFVFDVYLMDLEFKIYLTITVFFTTLVSVICMGWIIKKKRINRFISLFFISSLLFTPVLFYLLQNIIHSFEQSRNGTIISLVFLILTVVWLVGLVILLLKKPAQENPGNDNKIYKIFIARIIPNKNIIPILGILLTVSIGISVLSCIRMNTGYQLVTINIPGDYRGLPHTEITFECPKSYYPQRYYLSGPDILYIREQIKPFKFPSTYLEINYSTNVTEEGNPVFPTLVEQCIYFYYRTYYGEFELDLEIQDLNIKTIYIDNIEADYAEFTRLFSEAYYYNPNETISMVCFEHDGIIWTISMIQFDATTHNKDFEHILQTFKIIG